MQKPGEKKAPIDTNNSKTDHATPQMSDKMGQLDGFCFKSFHWTFLLDQFNKD